uniref:Uncharacterized protein n=1 Tax=Anguilla anguilla TaxID=7936 RepID=A0A0E9Y1Z2_ANGAN
MAAGRTTQLGHSNLQDMGHQSHNLLMGKKSACMHVFL